MPMKKGISPLIAVVVLVAFVIGIAALLSGFFTGFIKGRTGEIEEKGGKAVKCTFVDFNIDPKSVAQDGSSLLLHLETKPGLKDWTFTVSDNLGTHSRVISNFVPPGGDGHFNLTKAGLPAGPQVYKITASPVECPGLKSTVRRVDNEWQTA